MRLARRDVCAALPVASAQVRGRSHGWLRETLEGAIHLPITGLLAPDARPTRWIVQDFEDNLYISDQYGYAIPAFDRSVLAGRILDAGQPTGRTSGLS